MCTRFAPELECKQSAVANFGKKRAKVRSASGFNRSHKNKKRISGWKSSFCWCGRRELNPYGKTTRPSNVRVCQFRHSRNGFSIIHELFRFVKSFFQKFKRFFAFIFLFILLVFFIGLSCFFLLFSIDFILFLCDNENDLYYLK